MQNSTDTLYNELHALERERRLIEHIQAILEWDEQTVMPASAAQMRGEQRSIVAKLFHEKLLHPRLLELTEHLLAKSLSLSTTQISNVKWVQRKITEAKNIPVALVVETEKQASLSHAAWVTARAQSNFKIYEPHLAKMIELKKQFADCLRAENSRYDALLSLFDFGVKTQNIELIFNSLKTDLLKIRDNAIDKPWNKKPSLLNDYCFPKASQEELCKVAIAGMGFDPSWGLLGTAVHPFCSTLGKDDIRITTRYQENQLSDSLFGALHEAGHALYERGLSQNNEAWGLAETSYCSMSVHEANSRFWENNIGRSKSHSKYIFPKLQNIFPTTLTNHSRSEWFRSVNHVEMNWLRVQSDEVHYNLHIILRFLIEQEIINNDLPASEIPNAWNTLSREIFGDAPPTDSLGCLQDVHWAFGGFGYFPTYALGNLIAAQMHSTMKNKLPNFDENIADGNFDGIKSWLHENISIHGATLTTNELVEKATGEKLQARHFIHYLNDKHEQLADQ